MTIKFIDLFAGIGGFGYGLEEVGKCQSEQEGSIGKCLRHKGNNAKSLCGRGQSEQEEGYRIQLRFDCVWSNEWNKYARQIYKKHWGECDGRDIRTIPTSEIPDHDLLCAGFPCPTFSIAGKRKGFDDIRGAVFFEIPRILHDKRPRYFLLENVKGLLSHQEGKTFQTILGVLSDLGYRVEWQVLNSKHFGVPQNRERVFIIGHLGGEGGFQVFPINQSSQGDLAYSAGVISARQKWLKEGKNYSREFSQGQRIYSTKGIAQTLAGNAGGLGAKTGLYQIGEKGVATSLDSNYDKGWLTHGQRTMIMNRQDGIKRDIKLALSLNQSDWRGLNRNQDQTAIVQPNRIRRLTPIECERLQGFPDNWTEGISDTQRYKCLGNAVTTNVIEAIGKVLVGGTNGNNHRSTY